MESGYAKVNVNSKICDQENVSTTNTGGDLILPTDATVANQAKKSSFYSGHNKSYETNKKVSLVENESSVTNGTPNESGDFQNGIESINHKSNEQNGKCEYCSREKPLSAVPKSKFTAFR